MSNRDFSGVGVHNKGTLLQQNYRQEKKEFLNYISNSSRCRYRDPVQSSAVQHHLMDAEVSYQRIHNIRHYSSPRRISDTVCV